MDDKYIVCVDNETCVSLTVGKVYQLIREDHNYFYVVDDRGGVGRQDGYYKSRFKPYHPAEDLIDLYYENRTTK